MTPGAVAQWQRAALPSHDRQYSARHPRQPEEVDLEHPTDLVLIAFFDCAEISDAGVVHQHVDPAETLVGAGRGGLDLNRVGHVQLQNESTILSALGNVFNFRGIAGSDDGAIATIENHFGDLAAEAGGAAGDEPYFFSFESSFSLTSHLFLSWVGFSNRGNDRKFAAASLTQQCC